MKKLLIIFGLLTIFSSCSKDDNDASTTFQFDSSALEVTGDLSEQSVEEAKKIIYGKWDFQPTSTGRSICELVSIEFSNQNFFMTLDIGDRSVFAGRFTLGEDASGKVEKVELKYIFDDNSEIVIAVLTNLVVTKTGDDLNATFDIAFAFPINSEVQEGACNDALSGNIEAKKAEPMTESMNSSADTNHAKFIGTWEMASVITDDGVEAGLEGFLNRLIQNDTSLKYTKTYNTLAEGNFVYTQSEGVFANIATALSDIWRIEGGKIVEHWSVTQAIPEHYAHDNGMF